MAARIGITRHRPGIGRFTLALTVWALWVTGPAEAQPRTFTVQADPASLGPIPDGPGGTPCVTTPPSPKVVTFTVNESGPVVGLALALTFAPTHAAAGELTITLVSPGGARHPIFTRPGAVTSGCGAAARLAGPYTFTDTAPSDFFLTTQDFAGSTVPPGNYRAVTAGSKGVAGTPTSLDAAFVGQSARGVWTLVVTDGAAGNSGGIAAASLTLTAGTSTSATPGTTGPLPTVNCFMTPAPISRDLTFDVNGISGAIRSLSVSLEMNVVPGAAVGAELIGPGGVGRRLLFPSQSDPFVVSGDLRGHYDVTDFATRTMGYIYGMPRGTPLASGPYQPIDDQLFPTALAPVFAGRSANGRWTLRVTNCGSSQNAITNARIAFVTETASAADTYAVESNTPLTVAAPGVLANDSASGRLSATLTSVPASGTVLLNSDGSFTYRPNAGFVGRDRFEYRASAPGSSGQNTVATIDVTPPTARPPSNVEVVSVVGNHATLRWLPPAAGPAPTSFELTAGTSPGQVLARVPLPPDPPVFEVDAPPGVFFLRLTTQSPIGPSGPSNDARLSVGVPDPPSPPASLTGLVNGDILTLHWKDTFAGGAPTGAVLDVSGAFTGSLPVPAGGGFSFPGVPPGTYTFALRATNAAGVSSASNPVTLTFPGACSGPPATPTRFLAFARGSLLGLLWDPPTAGAAADRYQLHVTGSFTGTVPMGLTRSLTTPVPPGAYTIAVSASNPCGTSAPTAATTVVIP